MTACVSVVQPKQWCCFAMQKNWTGAGIVANSKRSCCLCFVVVVAVVEVVIVVVDVIVRCCC